MIGTKPLIIPNKELQDKIDPKYRRDMETIERHVNGLTVAPAGASPWESGSGLHSAELIGTGAVASGNAAVAEGTGTAGGSRSHAEGSGTQAGGRSAHAEGESTIAGAIAAHAEGSNSIASGNYSHAGGFGAVVLEPCQSAQGCSAGGIGNLAQYSFEPLSVQTLNATPAALRNQDGTGGIAITRTDTCHFRIYVVARGSDGAGDDVADAAWLIEGLLAALGPTFGNFRFIAAPVVTVIARDAGAAAWTVATTQVGLLLVTTVTGAAGQQIDWMATVHFDLIRN